MNNISLQELISIVELKMNSDLLQKPLNEHKLQGKLAEIEKDLRVLATQGSREARDFIKSKITLLLSTQKNYVDSNNIDRLIREYQVNYYENIYSGSEEYDKIQIDIELEKYFFKYSIHEDDSFGVKMDKLTQICYQEIYGFSVLDELIFDSDLNEVACNRYDYIWVQYKGIKRKIPNQSFIFESKERYEIIVENRITSTARNEMNNGEPITYSVLENGSRVTALRPPLSRYFIVSIRIFNNETAGEKKEFTWTFTKKQDLKPESIELKKENKVIELLEILIKKGRRNIAIIGEQGSGKTTAADKIVIRSLDEDLSIGLAENVHELDISRKYKNKNIIELQYGRNFTPTDVMEMFFRLNRDVVIFGEVRNHFEAFEMLKAMLRQARGSLFTFHSSSVKRMVHDLRQLLMQTGYYKDYREAQFDVADAVDIIIHVKLDRKTGERYIYRVCELVALEENMSYKINNLFVYEKEEGIYLINRKGIDKSTIEDCLSYELNNRDIAHIKEILTIKPFESNLYRYMNSSIEGELSNAYDD